MSFDDLKPLTNEEMGVNSVIYTGLLEEQLVFIKIGSDPRHFRVETSALDLLHRHNVPTPRILAFTERASFINRPLMIQTAAEGIPLNRINPEKDRLQIWELAGKTLKQIHAIQIEGFGKLDVEQGKLSGELTSWKEWVAQAKKRTDYLVEHEFITQDETEKIGDIFADPRIDIIAQASFLHGDYQAPHIFTNGQNITGIIDVASSVAGDPLYEVAYTHYYLSPEEKLHFNTGYGAEAKDPITEKYLLLIAVKKLAYRHRKGLHNQLSTTIHNLTNSLSSFGIR